jgi:hypothetical protein
LTAWALLMIVPDFYRIARPLASAGFAADNDGLIHDVRGPFPTPELSPAWQAGLRQGDRLDLAAMACRRPATRACADLLAVLGGMGGMQLVQPGRVLMLTILPAEGGPARDVRIAAAQPPVTWLDSGVLVLNEVIATLFVLAAAWLVWTRPGWMTWGFFVYACWFNSGQNFMFYAILHARPGLLLAQEFGGAVLQGAAFAGFLLFVLRAPSDRTEPAWRRWQFGLPLVAAAFVVLQLASYANSFGYRTEIASRATFIAGFAVDAAALLILLRRRRGLPPQDYQRMRWILWGCAIGLPAFIVGALLQSTTLWHAIGNEAEISALVPAALYALHGLLGWFVFEAVRRPRVVSVSVPLRRITIFGLMLSVPALFLHKQIEQLHHTLHLPTWAWIGLASVLLFLAGRAHELGVELADQVFNRAFRREVAALQAVSHDILRADDVHAIERLLTEAPMHTLGLASAALFRRHEGRFHRHADGHGWAAGMTETLDPRDAALAAIERGEPFPIDPADAERLGFPAGVAAPTVAVPVGDPLDCHAVALYGPHASGAELSEDEQAMLARLAADAALAYSRVERESLRRQVADLQARLAAPMPLEAPG